MKKQEIESGDNIRVVNEWNEVLHGQLHYWDKFNDDGCLVMKNVFYPSTQNYSAGTIRLFNTDIKKVELLESKIPDIELELNHSSIARSRNNSLCAKIDSSMSCNESFNNHDMTITSADSAIKKNKIDLSKYNYNLNSDYGSSASILKSLYSNVKIISLRIFTNDSTRNDNDISVICIHADDWTYIFDVNSIAQEDEDGESEAKFINLLKIFLTKPNIIKIIYDSHFIADLLFHKYNITLDNVFDIKMASKEIQKETDLSKLEFEYLIMKFAPEIEENKLAQNNLITDWKKRPFNKNHKYHIIRQTACLFNLYTILKEKLIDSFISNCDRTIRFAKNRASESTSSMNSEFNQRKSFNKKIHSSDKSMRSRNCSSSENMINDENLSSSALNISSKQEDKSTKLKSFFQKIEDNRKARSLSDSNSCDSFNSGSLTNKSGPRNQTLGIPPAGISLQNYIK